ncbi:hypothetical protein GCM10027030_04960 [Luteococcus sediminum]
METTFVFFDAVREAAKILVLPRTRKGFFVHAERPESSPGSSVWRWGKNTRYDKGAPISTSAHSGAAGDHPVAATLRLVLPSSLHTTPRPPRLNSDPAGHAAGAGATVMVAPAPGLQRSPEGDVVT